uniref:UPAR/Ly6 domain-containing protein n=1 Tax=Xenopus tropicalis TaxID=8364 RepID=A0A803JXQ3_XENTR
MGGTEPSVTANILIIYTVPLQCYTCGLVTSNADCLTPTNCSESDTSCMTSVAGSVYGGREYTLINKICTSNCTPSDSKTDFVESTVSCCNTDLCNVSAAPGVKYSYPALGLSLGFLLVLLRGSAL